MSRRGNCYGNAYAKPFCSRLKTELLDVCNFPELDEVKPEIGHHIFYYNAEQRHASFGYLASSHFETHLQTASQLYPA